MPDPKFCKDCKWFVPYERPDYLNLSRCSEPTVSASVDPDIDWLVTGGPRPHPFASTGRVGSICGAAAALWQPKEPQP